MQRLEPGKLELQEKVVQINRVAKVVKGGRRFRLTALVVVGDGDGHVGVGRGKAKEVPVAIQKGIQDAKKNMASIPRRGSTIPHAVLGHYGAGKVLLKPASAGTGLIAGGPIRAVLELAGVRDVLAKSLGSANTVNMLRATMAGLRELREPSDVAALRGKPVEEIVGWASAMVQPSAGIKAREAEAEAQAIEKGARQGKVAEKKAAAKPAGRRPAVKKEPGALAAPQKPEATAKVSPEPKEAGAVTEDSKAKVTKRAKAGQTAQVKATDKEKTREKGPEP